MLRRLRDLPDFEMASGDPDVRNWPVRGRDGRPFGHVHEVIVEPETLRVRYLDIELDNPNIADENRHILLPIGVASLDTDGDNVFVPQLDRESVLSYPPYVEIEISRDYETAMMRALGLEPVPDGDYYSSQAFESQRFYGNRRA